MTFGAPAFGERVDPPAFGDERATLLGYLNYQRATLLGKCAGLSPAQLARQAVPPSELSLLGLLRHLADVERSWVQRRVAGLAAPPLYYSAADRDGEFHFAAEAGPAELDELAADAFATWQAEVAASDAILAGVESLDQGFGTERGEQMSIRWLLAHLIEEYARHNGHADLLRELIDGETGE